MKTQQTEKMEKPEAISVILFYFNKNISIILSFYTVANYRFSFAFAA